MFKDHIFEATTCLNFFWRNSDSEGPTIMDDDDFFYIILWHRRFPTGAIKGLEFFLTSSILQVK
jgi:hypothetical protein